MKRFSLSTIAAGLALAVMSGPLAFAQQYHDTHGRAPVHVVVQHRIVHVMPMRHAAPPRRVVVQHYAPAHSMHGQAPMHDHM